MNEKTDTGRTAGPPDLNDYLPEAVGKAVVNAGLTHPLTVYPVALGVSGAMVGFLFQIPLLLAASIGLGLLGPAWAVTSIFFRHEAMGAKYLKKLHQKQKAYEKHLVGQLEAGLEECARIAGMESLADQGVDQLKNIRVKLENIKDLLDMKLHAGEITHGRFLGAAEQVSLSVLDNLKTVVGILKSAGSIQPDYIRKRLKIIARKKENSAEDASQAESLKQRLALWESQLTRVNRLLARNEEAMTEMEVISASVAQWETDRRFSPADFESAIDRLRELARQAYEYNT